MYYEKCGRKCTTAAKIPPRAALGRDDSGEASHLVVSSFYIIVHRFRGAFCCTYKQKRQGNSVQDKHAVTLSCIHKANVTGQGMKPCPIELFYHPCGQTSRLFKYKRAKLPGGQGRRYGAFLCQGVCYHVRVNMSHPILAAILNIFGGNDYDSEHNFPVCPHPV